MAAASPPDAAAGAFGPTRPSADLQVRGLDARAVVSETAPDRGLEVDGRPGAE